MRNNTNYLFYGLIGHLFSLFVGFFLLSSCKDEGGDESVTVDGRYKVNSATLISNPQFEGLKKGDDVTRMVTTAFFSVHKCEDEDNVAMDLRESNELYFVCEGEDSVAKAGTWSLENKDTEMRLNLAPPLFPIAFSLTLKDLKFDKTSFSGNSFDVPVPRWIAEGSDPPSNPTDLSDPKNLPIQDFDVALAFEKR